MKFAIYRYNPDVDAAPRMQDYDIALEPTDRMLLDALIRIKEQDDSLSLRRSCREGVCGSDAMNINGKNGLACISKLADLKEPVVIRPLPGLPVIRDLIVDMSQFCLKNCDMSTIRSRITGSPGSGRITTGSLRSASFEMHARPFLPLMFIASDPHTPSRHERRSDRESSCSLMRISASSSMRSVGSSAMS